MAVRSGTLRTAVRTPLFRSEADAFAVVVMGYGREDQQQCAGQQQNDFGQPLPHRRCSVFGFGGRHFLWSAVRTAKIAIFIGNPSFLRNVRRSGATIRRKIGVRPGGMRFSDRLLYLPPSLRFSGSFRAFFRLWVRPERWPVGAKISVSSVLCVKRRNRIRETLLDIVVLCGPRGMTGALVRCGTGEGMFGLVAEICSPEAKTLSLSVPVRRAGRAVPDSLGGNPVFVALFSLRGLPCSGRLRRGEDETERRDSKTKKDENEMAWFYLILGGFFEMGWAVGLKLSQTMQVKAWGILLAVMSMSLSMFLLYLAQRTLAIGTAYVVWTGIGAVSTLLVGIFFFGDSAGFWRLFSAGLIVLGVIGLRITA